MNEALILGSLRQHELTEAAERLNAQLQTEIAERKQAEQSARASEARYRILFDSGSVAIYSCDATGVIQNFNSRAVELWGRKPASGETDERFCGSNKLFRPNGRLMRHVDCPMAAVLSGKIPETRDQEVIIERPDASRLACVVNIRPLKNERGEITGAINCFYDITERKAAEKAQRHLDVLTASNAKLQKEIVRRQTVERALHESERHQRRLLGQSHQMQGQLRQLSRQILSAQEEERRRISIELHDVIGQTLTGINVRLAMLQREAAPRSETLARSIAVTQRLVEQSVDVVHRFARELRPAVLDDLGLIPALRSHLKEFLERTGIRVELSAYAGIEKLGSAVRTVLYRIAQEALNNVARHAQASHAKVSIHKHHHAVRMEIHDNGKGFEVDGPALARPSKRLGLVGMRERAEMIGGKFQVESKPGQYTIVRVEIPAGTGGGENSARKRSGKSTEHVIPCHGVRNAG